MIDGLAVVVAEADGPAVGRSARSAAPSCRSLLSTVSWSHWAAHWNGVCGLGTNPPMDTVQRMSLRPLTSRPVLMTRAGQVGDGQHVLVGLGRAGRT